jgi:hypothetical protein
MNTFGKYYLFLDESGDHSLDKIDPQYPVFVLGGALISDQEYQIVDAQWKTMKSDLFGTDEIIIHTADMSRNKNGFQRMKETDFRERVYKTINENMASLPYTALGCVVKKDEHMERYGLAAVDPYHLSLQVIVERAFYALGRQGELHIVAESRNQHLDQLLEIAFLNLKVQGTRFIASVDLQKVSPKLHIREKAKNISGLQLADLLVSPMGRYVLGKRAHADWGIIEEKLYRHREKWEGAGLVVLPK